MHGVHSAMDEKRRLAQQQHQQQHGGSSPSSSSRTISKPSRVLRHILAAVFVLFILCYYAGFNLLPHVPTIIVSPARHRIQTSLLGPEDSTAVVAADGKVPLEVHIISKCPDTKDALQKLVLPAMQRVSDKVDFTLSYIGTLTENDGVECKHGPEECLGNILELCARELYPDPKISLGFVMCLTRDFEHIPERALIEDCALEHAVDFRRLNECATRDDGAHGMMLMRNSVSRTADAGVTVSATIRLNNEVYCVRDGGEWIDCPHGCSVNELVISIEKHYRA